jgi:hypothetical protein
MNKTRLPKPIVVHCPTCKSDDVDYDAYAERSFQAGGRETTQRGMYTCLQCNHRWHQPAPKIAETFPVLVEGD